ncbi:MAG: DnaA/Hda family protein [Alphaproteobacteria bacterium]|nr:DnaA/Hda family protein [Alphaproteobacteria bacterium]
MQQIPLPLPHDAAMGADDFLVTSCNREAAAWVGKWPDWPAHGLILTGPAGCGKTHLLHLWLAKSGGALVTLDELIAQDCVSLTAKTQAIALDDADAVAGHDKAEESLFHLYNHLQSIHGWLLLTMTRGAGLAPIVLPDLRSRLLTLPAAALHDPDDALLEALIVKQFRDRQVALDAEVVAYLAPRMPRDAAGIRDLVERLDRAALAAGRKISIALARNVLEGHDV